MQTSISSANGFFIGQFSTFKGVDSRGVLSITGTISRLWEQDGMLFAAIWCKEILDKHCGLVRYDNADVTRTLQLTGDLVDVLHGRRLVPA